MITTSTYARGVYHLTFTSDLDEPKMRSLNFPSPSAPPNFSWSFSFRPGGGGGGSFFFTKFFFFYFWFPLGPPLFFFGVFGGGGGGGGGSLFVSIY